MCDVRLKREGRDSALVSVNELVRVDVPAVVLGVERVQAEQVRRGVVGREVHVVPIPNDIPHVAGLSAVGVKEAAARGV